MDKMKNIYLTGNIKIIKLYISILLKRIKIVLLVRSADHFGETNEAIYWVLV